MKKFLLSLGIGVLAAGGASAQLAAGSVAPDFTVKDLNGNSYNLYTLLNQGKTVFLDVSAAWCAPCWAYHNAHHLEALYAKHGPAGATGVNANTTNDVMVFFIEGESTNTTAQLYGPAVTTGTHANITQGNWVAGTPYPIVDSNAAWTTSFDQNYSIGYFPTIYKICRDHLIEEVGQVDSNALYASVASCPNYGPATGTSVDAKAAEYSGASYFLCTASPTVKFQNYSATTTITAATIKVYSGTAVVATYNWTGSLAPYAVASVTIPSFAGTNFMPYKYDVTVTNDSHPTNNTSQDSVFKIYTAAGAVAIPWNEPFATANAEPIRMSFGNGTGVLNDLSNNGTSTVIGTNGQQTSAVYFDFFDLTAGTTSDVLLGNFNTASASNVAIDFDYAHGGYAGGEPDQLDVQVSKDCGTTWNTVWSKSAAALETGAATHSYYRPLAASDWKHGSALLTAYKDANMFVKVKATSGYGNMAWMDNFKITNSLAVTNVIADNSVHIAPNPAQNAATLTFSLSQASDVQVQILDAVGRVVSTVANSNMQAGQQSINLNTTNVPAGLYNVVIRTGEGVRTERLSVVK